MCDWVDNNLIMSMPYVTVREFPYLIFLKITTISDEKCLSLLQIILKIKCLCPDCCWRGLDVG